MHVKQYFSFTVCPFTRTSFVRGGGRYVGLFKEFGTSAIKEEEEEKTKTTKNTHNKIQRAIIINNKQQDKTEHDSMNERTNGQTDWQTDKSFHELKRP